MSKSNLYQQLVDFRDGKIPASKIDDNLITKVKNNGIISLDMGDKYFEIIVGDNPYGNDKYYLERACYGGYGYYDYYMYDGYTANEDFDYGYVIGSMSDENIDYLSSILTMFGYNPEDDPEHVKAAEILNQLFERIADDLIREYSQLQDSSMEKAVEEFAKDELCNVFQNYGIFNSGDREKCFRKYATTLKNLISLYESQGKYDDDLESLLKHIAEDNTLMGEDIYEIGRGNNWHYFDNESWNSYVKSKLDELEEKVEEESENVEGYKDIMERLKKFKLRVWYDLPKNDKVMFKINYVSLKTLDINFAYKNKGSGYITDDINMDIDRFLLFLYHPELF